MIHRHPISGIAPVTGKPEKGAAMVLLLLLALALLIFGVIGTIKIAAWLVLFIILGVVLVAIIGGVRWRGGRGAV
jgi:hypothetical protein